MIDYEKLGAFYLGKEYDLAKGAATEDILLYDSKDLLTHALTVGMTGSGKTGLCISIIEEAAIDGIPAILIDPKGDLTNLLLNFPALQPADLASWVNPDDAAKKGLSIDDFAKAQAALWEKGLADWGQSKDRIQRLRDAVDMAIYTPGSTAGRPVSILKTLSAPPAELLEDTELFQEKVSTTVSSILGLVNITADPLNSREHILLSNLISQLWSKGQNVDLAGLISAIQKPPFNKIGVLDLESFYPEKERFALMMSLNNLIASPGFATWLEGDALEIADMFHTKSGKPRIAIFSIAHLGDNERMFFVSLLLNQVLGWVRAQSGTSSLRALLYMDEIFGYFPPVQNPPSKKPLLSLLKQARAFGLGLVLSTQNPVDIDYKGLSNIGTWFIGRLQTERDKMKMLEGLEGAATAQGSNFDRAHMDKVLSGLGSRVFVMNNTHEDQPVVFTTRWCLSYLAGPLTRNQIKKLMDPLKGTVVSGRAQSTEQTTSPLKHAESATVMTSTAPALPTGIKQLYLPLRGTNKNTVYHGRVVAAIDVAYTDEKAKLNENDSLLVSVPANGGVLTLDWDAAERLQLGMKDLESKPEADVPFAELPADLANPKRYTDYESDAAKWAYGQCSISLLYNREAKAYSKIGEEEREFRLRVEQGAREDRDEAIDTLRKKYQTRINAAEEKVRKADLAIDREKDQVKNAGMQAALSVGGSLLGTFLGGRKLTASTISRAGTGIGRSLAQSGDVRRAEANLEAYTADLEALKKEMDEEIAALQQKMEQAHAELETVEFKPKKSDINVKLVALLWEPLRTDDQGSLTKAW